MTTMMHETSTDKPSRSGIASQIRELWGALAIAAMWLAVLFVGVYGGDVVTADGTRIPSAIFVAIFASLATWAVARRAFGSSSPPK
jgi:hypothetical protein